eukprot:GEMP01039339.1.p1 GENE.GEMP01039339.1~~GEMP01039339.1.p1  ORF type:complete len:259 (+),score=-1.17 GEMP01039339.1:117-893(+)
MELSWIQLDFLIVYIFFHLIFYHNKSIFYNKLLSLLRFYYLNLNNFYCCVFSMLRLLSLVIFCVAHKKNLVAPLQLRQGQIHKDEDDFEPQGNFEENWTQKKHWRTVPTKTCPSDEYSATMNRFLNSSSNRYYSDPRIYLAEDFIENELKSAGLQTFRQEYDLGGTKCYNVIGILPGNKDESRFVLIGAHHDTLPKVGVSQGVDDNGAGTVSLLEVGAQTISHSLTTIFRRYWSSLQRIEKVRGYLVIQVVTMSRILM